jgi:HEAT repeat protein
MGAAWAMGSLDPEGLEVPPGLVEALQRDSEDGVRVLAARAIGGLGPAGRPGIGALFEALDDSHGAVRHAAARALSEQKLTLEHLVSLEAALASDDTYVRAFGAWRLGNFGEAAGPAVPGLVGALEDAEVHTVVSAALARVGPGATVAVPALLAELSSDDANRRWRAARALGRIGPGADSAVPSLARSLFDPNEGVRRHAARALGRLGPRALDAAAELQRATGDPDEGVRREAEKALKRIQRAADGPG